MSAARTQVARLMALTPYLRKRPDGVPLSELAAEFGVSTAVMRRDLQTLVMCGLPELLPDDLIDIDLEAFQDDPDGLVRISNADFLARPARLASGESASLLVALESMRHEAEPGLRATIDVLRSKLETATFEGNAGKVQVLAGHGTPAGAELAKGIADAIAADRQVRISTLNPTRDEITSRVVDPVAVVEQGSIHYLDGWCHLTDSRRLFRLDRLQQVEALETPRVHSDLPARQDGAAVFQPGDADPVAVLRLARPARWIADYHPVLTRTEVEGDALEVTLHVADPRWLVRLVLSAAPDVAVAAPPEYAELVRSAAAATLAAYDDHQ